MVVSVFRVPWDGTLPDGRRPLRLGRSAVVGVVFAQYLPGGVLSYDELLVAIPSLRRLRALITIPQIWVDSPASMAGGRELWGIPKELGRFQRESPTVVALEGVAAVSAGSSRWRLPGRHRLPLTTLQSLDGRRIVSRNEVTGTIAGLRADWSFEPDGPLASLAGRTPMLSIAISDATITFGTDVER
jgi:hypothetical protein